MTAPVIETERLILRQWCDADRAPYAAVNADPEVMEHFPATLTSAESGARISWYQVVLREHGWGNFAVERRADGTLLGHAGVKPAASNLPLAGRFEAGWRFARHAWGFGYATEAARAILAYGFSCLNLAEIVAYTTATNRPSQKVMDRIGLGRRPDLDFDHPDIPEGHPLRRYLVYGASAP